VRRNWKPGIALTKIRALKSLGFKVEQSAVELGVAGFDQHVGAPGVSIGNICLPFKIWEAITMPIVTMTREMGTRGRDVAIGLAEALGLEIVHY
jgi:hypothetical protein